MDKQELISVFKTNIAEEEQDKEGRQLPTDSWLNGYENGRIDALEFGYKLAKWLDEPEITTEQAWEKIAEKFEEGPKELCATLVSALPPYNLSEKPEIPKFVADWIEEKRPYYSLMTMVGNYLNGFGMPERVEEWITDNKEDYLKALVIGYAIEKEPAWVVRINEKLYFCRFTDKYFEKDSDAPTYIESGNPSLIKKFTNKDKAEAVAILVDGTVEEWSE
ncbi:DUF1642 domain-containing protein [Tetragenococcus halophilus]|uniref:DUF1642 domain-containing protein n=1 Tax=Tetragenococcus halophilus TaxID=51669 RepID=UPI0015C11EA0|nr:DUF1642 domain-containing protein [Tetragenococcus halophilus]NWO00846.1 DUF1642 domain-containing protein [Tetragenococcus halophilus]